LADLAELADARAPSPMRAALDAVAAPQVATMLQRFRARGGDDDPLLAGGVLRALETPPFTGPSSRPLLEALVHAAERLHDPRLVQHAPAIARVWEHRVTPKPSRTALTRRLEKAAAAVAATPVREPSEAEAGLEAALRAKLRAVASTQRTHAELLADV